MHWIVWSKTACAMCIVHCRWPCVRVFVWVRQLLCVWARAVKFSLFSNPRCIHWVFDYSFASLTHTSKLEHMIHMATIHQLLRAEHTIIKTTVMPICDRDGEEEGMKFIYSYICFVICISCVCCLQIWLNWCIQWHKVHLQYSPWWVEFATLSVVCLLVMETRNRNQLNWYSTARDVWKWQREFRFWIISAQLVLANLHQSCLVIWVFILLPVDIDLISVCFNHFDLFSSDEILHIWI